MLGCRVLAQLKLFAHQLLSRLCKEGLDEKVELVIKRHVSVQLVGWAQDVWRKEVHLLLLSPPNELKKKRRGASELSGETCSKVR